MVDYNLEHGATYRYIKTDPLYPFGYGLSYTTFRYSNLQIIKEQTAENTYKLTVDVENTGPYDAEEVGCTYN